MALVRVHHVMTDLGVGGAERFLFDLLTGLDRDRFGVRVTALRGGPVEQWFRRAGIDVAVLGVRGKWDVGKVGGLVRRLREDRPDIVHTTLFHADLAGRYAARRAGVRRLVHTVQCVEQRFRPWQFLFARWWAGRCDRIVCVSDFARRHHQARTGLPDAAYTVIPNAIDPHAFAPDPAKRRAVRDELGLVDDQPAALFLGRLHPDKGADVLLDAVGRLARTGRDVPTILLAGDGPQREALEAQRQALPAAAREQVRLLGFVEAPVGLLRAADLVVMPSRTEGLPVAALEAMAAGRAMLATRTGGLPEAVEDGRTGLLVPPEDADALADGLAELLGDPARREAMGRAGRQRVLNDFAISSAVAKHEALYAELVGLDG